MRTPSRLLAGLFLAASLGAITILAQATGQTPQVLRIVEPLGGTMAVPNRTAGAPLTGSPVRARMDLVAQAAASGGDVEIPLTNGVIATAHVTYARVDGDHFFISGPLTGGPQGEASITTVGDVMVGRVVVDGRLFMIRRLANSASHIVTEVDASSFGADGEPVVPGSPAVPAQDAIQAGTPTAAADSSNTIDIMAIYTQAASNEAGGDAALEAEITGAVNNGNLALQHSGLAAIAFRLVHLEKTSYAEVGGDLQSDLTAVRTSATGLDTVGALRNQYHADVVTLIEKHSTINCGLGYLMSPASSSFAPFAFNVVDWSCANGNLSIAHETGHNMGLEHDRPNASGTPSFSYAYGYGLANIGRDVMAYPTPCNCQRLAIYSTPLSNFPGVTPAAPAGTATEDNTRALAQTMPIVSDFRSSVTATGVAISSSPANQTVSAGQTATFVVAATSSNPITYRWQVSTNGGTTFADLANSAPYSGVTTATLTVTSVTTALDGAIYHCVASDSAGSVTSGSAALTVNSAPVITTNPSSQTVTVGQTGAFTAVAGSHLALTYQWQVSNGGASFNAVPNNTTYSGATTATLSVANVSQSLSGSQYRVVATNTLGSATSTAAVLTVSGSQMSIDAPVAGATLTQPFVIRGWAVDRFATSGTGVDSVAVSAVLNPVLGAGATVTQLGSATYGLARTDVGSSFGHQFDNCGFTINVSGLAAGHYQLVVTPHSTVTGANVAPQSVIVDVAASSSAPTITTQPLNHISDATTGAASATFTVVASGTTTLTYQWQVSTDAGVNFANLANSATTTGVTTASLVVISNAAGSGNQYRCIVTNAGGSTTSAAATLRVTDFRGNLDVPAKGGFAAVPFTVSGWAIDFGSKGGTGVMSVDITAQQPGQSAIFLGTASYGTARSDIGSLLGSQFTNSGFTLAVSSLAAGTYDLTATVNYASGGTFKLVNTGVTVAGPASAPTITTQPVGVTPANGANAVFNVVATGSPLTYQWQVSSNGSPFQNMSITTGPLPYSGQTTSTLTVFPPLAALGVWPPQSTQYRVVVTNSLGSAVSAAATLLVTGASNPAMSIDAPTNGASVGEPFTVSGWAVDRGAASGAGVDSVKVEIFVSALSHEVLFQTFTSTYGGARADVGAVYGHQFDNCGYSSNVAGLPDGDYQIVVTPHSTVTGAYLTGQTLAVVRVSSPPVVGQQPRPVTVNVGQTATFTMFPSGADPMTIQWQVSTNGGVSFNAISNTAPYSGATSNTLTITAATLSLNGAQYRAVATNPLGTVTSTAATLTVSATAASNPAMSVDTPLNLATVSQPFSVSGWAVDKGAATGTGVSGVQVAAFARVGGVLATSPTLTVTATYGGARPDVAAAPHFGAQFTNCGFTAIISALPAGTYDLVVSATSAVSSAGDQSVTIFRVTVPSGAVPNPLMSIDTPTNGATISQPFSVAGWAVDKGASTGTGVSGVQVAAFAVTGGVRAATATTTVIATYGGARPDVAAALGSGAQFTNCAFTASLSGLVSGTYDLVVSATSTVSGTPNQSQPVRVTVPSGVVSSPAMNIDSPASGSVSAQPIILSGWAVDRGASSGTGVDAITATALPNGASPIALGTLTSFVTRTDVGAAFGSQFNNSGFSFNVTGLASGNYTLVVSAHSTVTGTNNISTVAITIPTSSSRPRMSLDAPLPNAAVGSTFTVSGWALDLSAASGAGVDGVDIFAAPLTGGVAGTATLVAHSNGGGARQDLVPFFGSQFVNAGFVASVSGLGAGSWRITAQAHSTVTGAAPFAQSADVTVAAGPVANPQMAIDAPTANASIGQPFQVRGWAVDLGATSGTGVDSVSVSAFAVVGGTRATSATTTVTAAVGASRVDVGNVFGSAFNNCGYTATLSGLASGTYDLVVSARSTVSNTVNQTRVVRVIVP